MGWTSDTETIFKGHIELINLNNIELIGLLYNNPQESAGIRPLVEFVISRLDAVMELSSSSRL